MLTSVVRKYQSWRRYRSTYEELSRLSNRELHDLGIARGNIDYFAYNSAR
ncbi:DUF1127 domain-containing protein [Roseibium suaedae]|uniref:Uncharacterized conserved protein YjiS, DUF1127 family n=1 Tax=Roseibium suaedae TaxID=735517 RepID=A0A1M7KZ94_9HYPH|nr:DUF1127 domain-containing protein [Roseibium suaedae]SHM70912.1 Uncharacterized conserved protein YjiS, DUF1127 family [Roseibium suaedae]